MNKTSIEWTDYSWNCIRGLCPTGCWYCYARKIYKRFLQAEKLEFHPVESEAPYKLKKPSKIFVCSTMELFHKEIPSKWRDWIFETIENCPQHTFQILTKFPRNIDRPMPDNVWLGVTVTRGADLWRIKELMAYKAIIRFVSYEPFLQDMPDHCLEQMDEQIDWLIVGRLTGYGKKYNPNRKNLIELVGYARRFNIPIFLKNNLKEIWGEPLIQEFPDV